MRDRKLLGHEFFVVVGPAVGWLASVPLAHAVRIGRKEQRGIESRVNRANQRCVGLDLAQRGFEFGKHLWGDEVEFVEQQ